MCTQEEEEDEEKNRIILHKILELQDDSTHTYSTTVCWSETVKAGKKTYIYTHTQTQKYMELNFIVCYRD